MSSKTTVTLQGTIALRGQDADGVLEKVVPLLFGLLRREPPKLGRRYEGHERLAVIGLLESIFILHLPVLQSFGHTGGRSRLVFPATAARLVRQRHECIAEARIKLTQENG